MSINTYLSSLVQYGVDKGLIEECDRTYMINQLLWHLGLDSYEDTAPQHMPLEDILAGILDDAVRRGLSSDSVAGRDLLDTLLMGLLTPPPREVRHRFELLRLQDPQAATEWFYRFSQDTDYIRRYRIQKDVRWMVCTEYGKLDVTVNLSKPEKDPASIAAAKRAVASCYPKCPLCTENEGYAGRINHPARQNHRVIPIDLCGEKWYFQYSPYVYYNEHCIVFNSEHIPMKIDRSTFAKLFEFVTLFPHYFIGSNADLPIVGGSILAHEHFQGGRQNFAMAKAPIEREICFKGYEDIRSGIVKWPMSVIRLIGSDSERLTQLCDKILSSWRSYTDESAFVFAETNSEKHNTITPIARRNGSDYEIDLVLRNNMTTSEHPLGVFHPHAELHHIKKENIGLIEVMGLAVLPGRLKGELGRLAQAVVCGGRLDEDLQKHAAWVERLKTKYMFTEENALSILRIEVGKIFLRVLEDAGVFKRTKEGLDAFIRFIDSINQKEA